MTTEVTWSVGFSLLYDVPALEGFYKREVTWSVVFALAGDVIALEGVNDEKEAFDQ